MPTQQARIQIRFFGRVQGVGFRATSCEIARRFEITGWVCNEPDGSVLLEAQGGHEEVEAYLSRIDERMSTLVDRSERLPIQIDREELGFEIRY